MTGKIEKIELYLGGCAMKWLIASDLHGSAECCDRLLDAYRREGAERLLLLGDILFNGHGTADKKGVADRLNPLSDRIICVRGNCDSDGDAAMLAFPVRAGYVKIPMGARTVFATHGDWYNEDNLPPDMAAGDILLHGHTHVPKAKTDGRYLCFNPGSAAQPLENSIRGYMTAEDGLFRWMTLEGEEYRRFDAS